MSGRKITGRFCEYVAAPRRAFDPKSFRWKKSGKAWLLIGCKLGRYKGGACQVGTRAHVVLKPSRGTCPRGGRLIVKG
jgi:hypothetical protein